MSNDKEIRENLAELNHISDGRILATPEELVALISTKQIEARIDEQIRTKPSSIYTNQIVFHKLKLVISQEDRLAELKSQLSTERKDDGTR